MLEYSVIYYTYEQYAGTLQVTQCLVVVKWTRDDPKKLVDQKQYNRSIYDAYKVLIVILCSFN